MLDNELKQHGSLNDEMVASKKKAEFFQNLLEAQRNNALIDKYNAMNSISGLIPSSGADGQLRQRTKQMHEKKLAKCERDIRAELLQGSENAKDNAATEKVGKNYQDIVKYHNLLQENLTKDMVGLTKMLKHNATVSNEIIKKDNELLEKTSSTASTELTKLQKNTNKIREFANAACEYATWILLFLVIFSFFGAVIFMRIMKKRS